jgi:polyhydroxyalkanoate synthesis regulator phasin
MSLEERVTLLETQVADLQATSRGWAEVAVSAASRAGIASDLLTKVYREVREIKGTLGQHTQTLDRHTELLDGHTVTLDGHTAKLDRHTELLEQILARLPDR